MARPDERDTGTVETTPKHIWLHSVTIAAGITADQAAAESERISRWYHAGEPVWMAADSLRFLFRQRAIYERAEREKDAAAAILRRARGKKEETQ